MNLFYIRNLMSIVSAEAIIKKYGITDAMAYIVNNTASKDYYQKLRVQFNQDLWVKIELFPTPNEIKLNIKKPFTFRSTVTEIEKTIESILKKNSIMSVFLSNINDTTEKIIFIKSKKLKLKINYYEEGINLYYDIGKDEHYLKRIIKKLVLGKYYYIINGSNKFVADNVYCFMPEKYTKRNYHGDLIKIKLNLENHEITNTLKQYNVEVLFLSRPLSEDGIISLEDEVNVFQSFISSYDTSNVYVKFHPRESKEKIDLFKKRFGIKELPDDIKSLSAEQIVYNCSLFSLIGYDTSTIAYISFLRKDIEVISILRRISDKSKYLEKMQDYLTSNFKDIHFI